MERSHIMKSHYKFIALFTSVIILVSLFTACQPTPEDNLIMSKKDSIEEKVISNKEKSQITDAKKEDKEQVQEENDTPEIIDSTYSTTLESGGVKIIVDAEVDVPKNDLQSVVMSRSEITQELADRFVKYFAGDEQLYIRTSGTPTYSCLEQELLLWEKNLFDAENNWEEVKGDNPHRSCSGRDAAIREYSNMVEQLKEQLKKTPKKAVYEKTARELVHPVEEGKDTPTGTEMYVDKSTLQIDAYHKAETSNIDDKMARFYISSKDGIVDIFHYDNVNYALENGFMLKPDEYVELGKTIKLPLDEAKAYAEEAIKGITDYEMIFRGYSVNAAVKDGKVYPYYRLDYCKSINGVAVAYMHRANILSRQAGYSNNYAIENLCIDVDDSGVIGISWDRFTEFKETLDDDVSIMSFDEIKSVFEKQMPLQVYSENTNLEIVIKKVSLTLMPVLMKNSKDMVTVPVWNFLGYHYNPDDMEQKQKAIDANFLRTYLTINAIDGSVINSAQGY